MKKKSKKPTKKRRSGLTLFDRLPSNDGEWLELAIKFTLRGVSIPPITGIDRDMIAQADRLKQKLNEWRKNERHG